jgi:Na+(H+)/acetate symporter ActP
MLLALNPFGDIVSITAFAGSLYAACFLPSMIIGLYWKRGTRPAAIANLALGAVVTIGWYFARRAGWTEWHEVYVGTTVAVLTYIGVSLATPGRKMPA